MKQDTKEAFERFEKALKRLKIALSQSIDENDLVIDGTIQRFEFTFELFWKAVKKLLFEEFGIDTNAPRKALEAAYQNNLIQNEEVWIAMLRDRNLTSHTYKEDLAIEIYHNIKNQYFDVLDTVCKNFCK